MRHVVQESCTPKDTAPSDRYSATVAGTESAAMSLSSVEQIKAFEMQRGSFTASTIRSTGKLGIFPFSLKSYAEGVRKRASDRGLDEKPALLRLCVLLTELNNFKIRSLKL